MSGFDFEYMGVRVTGDDDVYKPSEDSILLLHWVLSYSNPGMDLDIDVGAGSGIIGIGNALANRRYTILIDVSFNALCYAIKNSGLNGVGAFVEPILWNEDLMIFREDLSLYVMSNPPYLPVDNESMMWCGGPGGLDILLGMIDSLFARRSFRIIFVFSSLSDLSILARRLEAFSDITIEVVDWIEFPMETLYLGLVCR